MEKLSEVLSVHPAGEILDVERQVNHSLTESQRERLTNLGADLHALWRESETPIKLKNRVLRTVINEIIAD